MSLEGISQQTAVTCGSRFCNLFQNRYVAGSTLVISALVSFIVAALLIVYIRDNLLTQYQADIKKHALITQVLPVTVSVIVVSALLAKVLRLPLSWKPVLGIPVVVSVIITTIIKKRRNSS